MLWQQKEYSKLKKLRFKYPDFWVWVRLNSGSYVSHIARKYNFESKVLFLSMLEDIHIFTECKQTQKHDLTTSDSLFPQENTPITRALHHQSDITDCIFQCKNICTEWKTEYMPHFVLCDDIHALLSHVFWGLKKLLNIYMMVSCFAPDYHFTFFQLP